jgi:NhaP-type Na+/H+ or K+/H+ antiporter
VVTVATALAVPVLADDGSALGWREQVVLVGLGCVLVTLVAQGLTLTPLVRRLRVGSDGDERAEVAQLRQSALRAALDTLRSEADDPPDPADEAVIRQYEARLRAHEVVRGLLEAVPGDDGAGEAAQERLQRAVRRGNDVERQVALAARARGTVTPAAADEVLHDIEVRAARLAP